MIPAATGQGRAGPVSVRPDPRAAAPTAANAGWCCGAEQAMMNRQPQYQFPGAADPFATRTRVRRSCHPRHQPQCPRQTGSRLHSASIKRERLTDAPLHGEQCRADLRRPE
jgi:hypothetical protein